MSAYRYFYDCEFIEDGRLIDLVSIGVVDEHGREYYAVSTEFDDSRAVPWVRRNVLDKLPSPADKAWRSRERIREELLEFLVEPLRAGEADELELWAWYAAYDHVALAQLWGAMPALPREIPRFTKDLRQLWDEPGRPPAAGRGGAARRAGRRPAQPRPLGGHAADRAWAWSAGAGSTAAGRSATAGSSAPAPAP